jgi:hypothetical protein
MQHLLFSESSMRGEGDYTFYTNILFVVTSFTLNPPNPSFTMYFGRRLARVFVSSRQRTGCRTTRARSHGHIQTHSTPGPGRLLQPSRQLRARRATAHQLTRSIYYCFFSPGRKLLASIGPKYWEILKH